MRRQLRRSFSRSRSRSPYTYRNSRSRSRSPHYKTQISHIARKRTRSKSPNKYACKSRSPKFRTRTPDKFIAQKYSENDWYQRMRSKHNENNVRNHCTNPRNDTKNQEKNLALATPINQKEKLVLLDDKNRDKSSQSPTSQTIVYEEKNKRKKTEQELEDELLASTDSEASIKGAEIDEFKVTLDKEDLDFLDDDEEESENEGRFKSNTSSVKSTQQQRTISSGKSSYQKNKPGSFDQSKIYVKNYPRIDYKRSKYSDKDDKKRDKKKSRSPIDSSQRGKYDKEFTITRKKSQGARKSPETVCKLVKETIHVSNVITVNYEDKQNDSKNDIKKGKTVKPMFKSTFKSVGGSSDDNKKGTFCHNIIR